MIHRQTVAEVTPTHGLRFRETRRESMVSRLDMDAQSPGLEMHQLVHNIYNEYRHGVREPFEPFLRVSSQVVGQGRPLWRNSSPGDQLEESKMLGHYKILVYGTVPDVSSLVPALKPNFCLYILDGQTVEFNAGFAVQKLFRFLHHDCIYGTVRRFESTKQGRMRRDTRTVYYYNMSDARRRLGISRQDLRSHISEWIMTLGYQHGLYDFGAE